MMTFQSRKHTEFNRGSFLSFTAVMFAIELLHTGYGVVDLFFISKFGIEMIAAVGLGDLIVLLYLAFFRGTVDVYASRLARAEGGFALEQESSRLMHALFLVSLMWTAIAVCAGFLTPHVLKILGSDPGVLKIAAAYIMVRMFGLPFMILFEALAVTLRIRGARKASISIVVIGFLLNAMFNALFLFGPMSGFFATPVTAVAFATVWAQALSTLIGYIMVTRRFRSSLLSKKRSSTDNLSLAQLTSKILRTSCAIGIRQANNYAAAVIPFVLISRLGVDVIASATVATKIWTVYCRAPQAALNAAGVFIAYARGAGKDAAYTVANRCFGYVLSVGIIAALITVVCIPLFTYVLGGNAINHSLVWLLAGAYLVGIPFYLLEHFSGEILTLEQRGTWLSLPSTAVTYVIAIPMSVFGIYAHQSAVIAVLSSAISSAVLCIIYNNRVRSLGYTFFPRAR